MALMPKRVKYRKSQRGKHQGRCLARKPGQLRRLRAAEPGPRWIAGKQIEAGRVAASHFLAGEGRVWVRMFPHKSVTAKPLEVRMGTGKGDIDFWCAVVKPGTVMYEIGGVPIETARQALLRVAHKLPIRCRFVQRRHRI